MTGVVAIVRAIGIRGGIVIALGLFAALCWFQWGHWKGKHDTLASEAGVVLQAVREASDNPGLKWKDTAGQVIALGADKRALKIAIAEQNATIDEMAREAVRLRARAAELVKIANRAEAQRRSALAKLSDLSITPGTRDDCMVLLREAEEALDIVRQASMEVGG